MAWQFILTDLNGQVHGEIRNASERKVVIPHLRVPTATFTIPIWHEYASTIMDTDCLLKCYRTDPLSSTRTLAFNGPILSPEENADANAQSIGVTASGPYWRLSKRLVGKLKAGVSWGVGTPIDLGLIAFNMLDTTNGESFTGISKGTRTASINGTAGPWWLKNVAEGIAELSGGLNSFELEVVPSEPTAVGGVGGWPQIGVMNIAPIVGQARPDAIFEYGDGARNVESYQRKVDREGILNQAIMSVAGWPDTPEQNKDLRIRNDGVSIGSRGLFEEVVNDAGIIDDGLRDAVADFHVLIRKNPRQVITFKPSVNVTPSPFVDYKVGDTVRARATVRGILRFDALFRIWGLTFNVDENGNENVELELVMP